MKCKLAAGGVPPMLIAISASVESQWTCFFLGNNGG